MKKENNLFGNNTIFSSNANRLASSLVFYEKRLESSRNNKPYFFQREKLKKYNEEKEKLENIIFDLHTKIENEIDFYMN